MIVPINRMLFSFSRIGYVLSLLFQMARIPPPKGKWGIRLPVGFIVGRRASPDMNRIGRECMTEMYLMPYHSFFPASTSSSPKASMRDCNTGLRAIIC